jgi:hypothetical protein
MRIVIAVLGVLAVLALGPIATGAKPPSSHPIGLAGVMLSDIG